ncbi:MAG: DNA-processing protein DprA [Chloroherpetonaceae bacterium]|nr:DNA-processing protein DprA [Chloroherpetonaceae bacterium]
MIIPHKETLTFDLLVLSQVPGIGLVRLKNLINRFQTLENIKRAGAGELSRTPLIGEQLSDTISAFFHNQEVFQKASHNAEKQVLMLEKSDIRFVTFWDETYPSLLKEIGDAPAYFFIRGEFKPEDSKSVAIVGTRSPSEYGKNATKKIATELAEAGVTIISGLAIGVDTEAHRAALDAGGRTLAVLGNGIDDIYTDRSRKLFPRILENGAIITEEWIGTPPVAENFPKRNRIISGLSLGVVIVESDVTGGSLITAKYALEQNRDVFAIPGSIFSRKSNGTNALIRDGAELVSSGKEILESLNLLSKNKNSERGNALLPLVLPEMTEQEIHVFRHLSESPLHIDLIAERTGLDISEVLVALFELEFKDCAVQEAGRFFKKSAKYA